MKKQNGFTLIEIIFVLVVVVGFGSWVTNLVKFTNCDFESPYKCEVIHGAGVFVPPLSVITAWFSSDSTGN